MISRSSFPHTFSLSLADQDDTSRLARRIAHCLKCGTTFGLQGGLGAGKTTLIREIARALDSPDPISSPTYVLCNEYRAREGIVLEHWDLYRVESAPEELLESPRHNVIRLIEWIERSEKVMASCDAIAALIIPDIEHAPSLREVRVACNDASGLSLLQR